MPRYGGSNRGNGDFFFVVVCYNCHPPSAFESNAEQSDPRSVRSAFSQILDQSESVLGTRIHNAIEHMFTKLVAIEQGTCEICKTGELETDARVPRSRTSL